MRHAARIFAVTLAGLFAAIPGMTAPILEITPGTFDFGWAPDNAKVTAQFTIRNLGEEMVPLTAVKPTCGCTATDFTPDGLASQEEKRISLTFNTRGFANAPFRKLAKVTTDLPEHSYTVYLVGHVLKPDNGLVPDSGGIAGFEKGAAKKKTIMVMNKTGGDVTPSVVQDPAGWAKVKVPQKPVKAGESVPVEISVEGSLEEARDTSVTLAPAGMTDQNRVTLAIRTGPPPPAYRAYQPSASSSPKPAAPSQAK